MKKIKYFIFIFLFFFLFNINVFATENYSTNYNLTVNESTQFTDITYTIDNNIYTYHDIIEELISLNSEYYNLFIYSDFYNVPTDSIGSISLRIALIPISYNSLNSSIYGYGDFLQLYSNNVNSYPVYTLSLWSSSFIDTYNSLKQCYLSNISCSNSYNAFTLTIGRNTSNFSNSSSYNLYVPPTNMSGNSYVNYPVYSSIPIYLYNDYNSSDSSIFYKTLYINNVEYNINDEIPTYYDLYSIDNVESLKDFTTLSDNLLLRVNKNDISSFNYSFEFIPSASKVLFSFTTLDDYYNSLEWKYRVYGSKWTNNDYVQYDELDCSLSFSLSKTEETLISTANNLSCTSDLTNYTNLHISISYSYSDDSLSNSIYNPLINVSNNVIYKYGEYYQYIYDKFVNLPSYFKMYFSSNFVDSATVYSNNKKYLHAQAYGIDDGEFITSLFQENQPFYLSYGYRKSYNYLVYNDYTLYSGTSDIEVILGSESLISFSYTENNNNFYYYDENKNIDSINLYVNYNFSTSDSSYDLSYYFNQVSKFVDDFNQEINDFSKLTQTFYDNLPIVLQNFIFIIFILVCSYFTYLLIKR